jgi:hypothetical protein
MATDFEYVQTSTRAPSGRPHLTQPSRAPALPRHRSPRVEAGERSRADPAIRLDAHLVKPASFESAMELLEGAPADRGLGSTARRGTRTPKGQSSPARRLLWVESGQASKNALAIDK